VLPQKGEGCAETAFERPDGADSVKSDHHPFIISRHSAWLVWSCAELHKRFLMPNIKDLLKKAMTSTPYQWFIIGYHGCDESVAEKVLKDGTDLEHSTNAFDWLGTGTYFWEYALDRALEWATQSKKINGKIKTPSVIGAYIHLGNCFDLLDTRNTKALGKLFPSFCEFCKSRGKEIPQNKAAPKNPSPDNVMRFLDCAMINWYLDLAAKEKVFFQTV
jgi:hypothetical protein